MTTRTAGHKPKTTEARVERDRIGPLVVLHVGARTACIYGDTDIEVESSPATTRIKIKVRDPRRSG